MIRFHVNGKAPPGGITVTISVVQEGDWPSAFAVPGDPPGVMTGARGVLPRAYPGERWIMNFIDGVLVNWVALHSPESIAAGGPAQSSGVTRPAMPPTPEQPDPTFVYAEPLVGVARAVGVLVYCAAAYRVEWLIERYPLAMSSHAKSIATARAVMASMYMAVAL